MSLQIEKIEEEQQQGRRLDEGQVCGTHCILQVLNSICGVQLSKLKRKDDVLHKLAQLQI